MTTFLKHKVMVAKKKYSCDAWQSLEASRPFEDFMSEEDARVANEIFEHRGVINVGDLYVYQAVIQEGDFAVLRSLEKTHELCVKYDLFDED